MTNESSQPVREARGLPDAPLDAMAQFAGEHVPALRESGGVVLFDHAEHTHDSWRKAAVEELAREVAPKRMNAVVGIDEAAIARVLDYLDRAPGVTGQVFVLEQPSR